MRLLLALFLLAIAGAATAQERIALVIGNDACQHVARLDKAVADARAYKRHLEDERGFRVFFAEDADEAAMTSAIAQFLSAVGLGDTALVVYSGHGVQLDRAREDTLYLLPVDVPALDSQEGGVSYRLSRAAIQFSVLRDQLRERGASARVYVLDACRNNPFDTAGDGTRSVGLSKGLAPMRRQSGEFVFYAAAPGERALDRLSADDRDPNSVFSRVFLKHFRPGVWLEDIANQVQIEVYDLARAEAGGFIQEPWYQDGMRGKACLDAQCGAQTVAAAAPAPAAEDPLEALAKQAYDEARASGDPDRLELVAARFQGARWGDLAAREAANLRAASEQFSPPAWSPSVSELERAQQELKRLRHYDGGIDGIWGRGSQSALTRFQLENDIAPADGLLTQAGLEQLKRAPSPAREPAPPVEPEQVSAEPDQPGGGEGLNRTWTGRGQDRKGQQFCVVTLTVKGDSFSGDLQMRWQNGEASQFRCQGSVTPSGEFQSDFCTPSGQRITGELPTGKVRNASNGWQNCSFSLSRR